MAPYVYFRYMKARRFSNFVVVSCTYSRHGLRAMRHEFATFDLKKRVEFGENFGFRSENLALSSSRVSNSPFGTTIGRMMMMMMLGRLAAWAVGTSTAIKLLYEHTSRKQPKSMGVKKKTTTVGWIDRFMIPASRVHS